MLDDDFSSGDKKQKYVEMPLESFLYNFDTIDQIIFLHLMKKMDCKITITSTNLKLVLSILYYQNPKPIVDNDIIDPLVDYPHYAEKLSEYFTYVEKDDYYTTKSYSQLKKLIDDDKIPIDYDGILKNPDIVFHYESKNRQLPSLFLFEDGVNISEKIKLDLKEEMQNVENILDNIFYGNKNVMKSDIDDNELFREFLFYLIESSKYKYKNNKLYSEASESSFSECKNLHNSDGGGIRKGGHIWGNQSLEDILFYLVDRHKTNMTESKYDNEIPKLKERGYTKKIAASNTLGDKHNKSELSAALSTLITRSALDYCANLCKNNPLIDYTCEWKENKKSDLILRIRLLYYQDSKSDNNIIVSAFVDFNSRYEREEAVRRSIINQNNFVKDCSNNRINADIVKKCIDDIENNKEITRIIGTKSLAKKDRAKINSIYARILVYNINQLVNRYINTGQKPYFVKEFKHIHPITTTSEVDKKIN